MNYEIGITKFRHRSWGEGVLRKVEGAVLTIEFSSKGIKRLTEESIKSGILTIVTDKPKEVNCIEKLVSRGGGVRQYDSSDTVIGNRNIIESFETDDVVLFNESYVIVGENTSAKKISATYDLMILGDIKVDEIKVNGDLTVMGDISANKLTCSNTLLCQGHVDVDHIYVGSIIANSVKCVEFACDGNALVETTIDIDESSRTEKTMVACEGIMGAGSFSALNAIANEYFEFSGDIQGKVLELESDKTLSEIMTSAQKGADLSEISVEEAIHRIEQRLQSEYEQCGELNESAVIELTKLLGKNSLHTLSDYATIFDMLTNISYQDEIDDFGDYLAVVYAKKVLPESIYKYETIDHIDAIMLPKAEGSLEKLEFKPLSVEHIAQCIQIALKCADIIPMDIDCILDKIFSSFGIRYSTVKSILGKASDINLSGGKKEEPVQTGNKPSVNGTARDTSADMFDVEMPKTKRI